MLRRRRQRRNKRLKVRNQEEIAAKVERPAASAPYGDEESGGRSGSAPGWRRCAGGGPGTREEEARGQEGRSQAPEPVQESASVPESGEGEGA